jgi:uncharacterized protein DUF4232
VQNDAAGSADAASSTCRPADLHGMFRGFQGAGDSLAGAVVVVNGSSRPCTLDGSPRSIGLLDDGGDGVSVRERALDMPPGGPVQLDPGVALPAFGAPPAHGSAWLTVTWSNWCSGGTPAVQSMLVVLPGGGSIAAPLDTALPGWAVGPATPRCVDSRGASSLTFGRFQPGA